MTQNPLLIYACRLQKLIMHVSQKLVVMAAGLEGGLEESQRDDGVLKTHDDDEAPIEFRNLTGPFCIRKTQSTIFHLQQLLICWFVVAVGLLWTQGLAVAALPTNWVSEFSCPKQQKQNHIDRQLLLILMCNSFSLLHNNNNKKTFVPLVHRNPIVLYLHAIKIN